MSRGRNNPRRKNTGKKKNQSQGLPKTTLAVAAALVVMFIGGLYFIMHNKQAENRQAEEHQQPHHQTQGHGLPPKPEERWSYIKELENRPVNESSVQEPNATLNKPLNPPPQLTPEQKQLLEQIQSDMRQPPISLKEVPYNSDAVPRSHVLINPPAQPHSSEQKRAAVPESKPPASSQANTKPTANEAKLMLQCGSFRTMEQADSVRASLAFAGIESQITTKDNWNRVVLGPYKHKASAEKMRERVASAGVPGCILRPTGG
ncbi:cell division protein FtsN [Xenorhabdus kozodoii]|uniref:Cell division protein FtsN n=1 Tax=Xenorhabdus kozodoii TaxID=351676 RepID=A0A2D0LAP8_9GAMM|nr:cell division protein FtsN [Xenorhabdus kozodoii]